MENRIIEINLTTKEIVTKRIDEKILRDFLGGSGLAAYLMYRMGDYKYPPLSDDSILAIIPGLLTGRTIPTACKTSFCCRSPLTGYWNESTVGGFFGARMKQLKWDGLIIKGISEKWCYVLITKDKVEIRDAKGLIGEDTYRTAELLENELESKLEIACIGPAGERLINISSVVIGGRSSRLAARGGIGAVFGSKKLKGVAILGSGKIENTEPEKLKKSIAYVREIIPRRLSDFGTAGSVEAKEKNGDLPIHNWLKSNWKDASKVTGQEIAKRFNPKKYSCWFCPIGCGKIIEIKGKKIHGPEYETIASFGSLCDISDLNAIIDANDYCNRMGLDTMSAGSLVAFAMEASEKGLLKYKDDLEIKWGSSKTLLGLLNKIVEKNGIGEILSQGTLKAAEKIGSKAKEFCITSKGMEIAMHDPRVFLSQAISYSTGARGGCHLESFSHPVESGKQVPEIGLLGPYVSTSWEGKENLSAKMQDLMSIYNATGICKFLFFTGSGANKILEWINLSLNWNMDLKELMMIGSRIFNLKRIYNLTIGLTGIEERLPERFFKVPKFVGKEKYIININDFDGAIKRYYKLRNWDRNGIPSLNLIKKLNLNTLLNPTKPLGNLKN